MNGKILVFGADGLVGSRFTDLYHKETPTITPKFEELDITNKKAVELYFETYKDEFHSVINFAAYTDVDAAEKEKGNEKGVVYLVNAVGAQNLAEATKAFDKYLIHISTDFIFSGTEGYPGPYPEDAKLTDNPEDVTWYGWTKLVGEKRVRQVNKNASIVRISYPYRAQFAGKLDYARKILSLYDEGKLYPMFSDQKITPTFIDEAAKVFYLLLEEKKSGIYHVASCDLTTPFSFAGYILEKARGAKGALKEGSMKEFLKVPGRPPRPRLGGLANEKTAKELGMTLMTWREAVDQFVSQLKEGPV
ncbi:NAD(P)-dependent oxidoreductase [Candidatus Woesebacteria bacterium]|nr:NAD(P)-dependent oxidoreductase [Candidatus Woesebacteria bacterium]